MISAISICIYYVSMVSLYCDSTDVFICIDRKDGPYDSLKMGALYRSSISFTTVQNIWRLLFDLLYYHKGYKRSFRGPTAYTFNMSATFFCA
jgi:hypothetical protein